MKAELSFIPSPSNVPTEGVCVWASRGFEKPENAHQVSFAMWCAHTAISVAIRAKVVCESQRFIHVHIVACHFAAPRRRYAHICASDLCGCITWMHAVSNHSTLKWARRDDGHQLIWYGDALRCTLVADAYVLKCCLVASAWSTNGSSHSSECFRKSPIGPKMHQVVDGSRAKPCVGGVVSHTAAFHRSPC